jgi:hypothetical protein
MSINVTASEIGASWLTVIGGLFAAGSIPIRGTGSFAADATLSISFESSAFFDVCDSIFLSSIGASI